MTKQENQKVFFVFFLGGQDAEMCEICKILQETNQVFFDKHLCWGARLVNTEMS